MTRRQEAFVRLLEPERDALWRFARRHCWDRSQAEDCLQDAVMIAFRKLDVFTPGTSFRAWIFKILVNTVLGANSRLRRERDRSTPVADLDLVAALEREDAYASVLANPEAFLQQVSDPLRRAVHGLRPAERAVFLLRAAEGFSYREIADLLEIPMGTVMSHLFRARARLRETLAEDAQRAHPERTQP